MLSAHYLEFYKYNQNNIVLYKMYIFVCFIVVFSVSVPLFANSLDLNK